MKKLIYSSILILSFICLSACGKTDEKDKPSPTAQATAKPTASASEPSHTETVHTEKIPVTPGSTDAEDNITIPITPEQNESHSAVFLQKEGCISLEESISLLKTFLGTHDENGIEYNFEYQKTIEKDGIEYYDFKVEASKYYGDYIVSCDGQNIEQLQ